MLIYFTEQNKFLFTNTISFGIILWNVFRKFKIGVFYEKVLS